MNLSSPHKPEPHRLATTRSAAQALGPDSLAWRLGFPRTGLLLAGRALVLQVMHPVIGAGVRDFSDFKTDPWGRLDRTVTSLQVQLFGGAGAVDEAERLRALHGSIRGTGFDGVPYSALNQGAYAWVHMSNFDTLLTFDRFIAKQMHPDEREQLFAEWRQAGRVLGIRDEHMPSDLTELKAYVRDMITDTLTDNPTVRDVLATLHMRHIGPPPWRMFPEPLWRALRPLGRSVLRDTTVGTLPEVARQKLQLSWSESDQRRLRALALVVRTASAPVPDVVLQYPLARRAQVEAKRYAAAQRAS
jgi:uncharacterized protein (DUF2236 family)